MPTAPSESDTLRALFAAVEEPSRAASLPDDDATLRVARHHRLSPLLSVLCEQTLPPALAQAFRRDRLVTAARNLVLANAAEEVVRALAAREIPAIVLKGLDYEGRLYRLPGTRATGDVDLLVPAEQRQAAFRTLDQLGFEPRAAAPGFDDADYHEVAWRRDAVEVDLHLRLAPPARCRIDHTVVWAEAETTALGSTEVRVLKLEHAAIFHSLHMAIDHFEVPAIYLLDLARLVSAARDRRSIVPLARQWRCGKAVATALALTGRFLPAWRDGHPDVTDQGANPEVVSHYGDTKRISRARQLWRKLLHFDHVADAVHYGILQSRRNVREQLEKHVRKRTPRKRLAL